MIHFRWNKDDTFSYDNAANDRWGDHDILPHDKFVENGMKLDGLDLIGENDIVINKPDCNIYFDWPMSEEYVTFRIMADNKDVGFTRGEIALKAMQKYHMLAFLSNNYDNAEGKIRNEDNHKSQTYEKVFSNYYWHDGYYGNGLWFLKYEEKFDRWHFECFEQM